jgi:hypothetical protein
MPNSISSVIEYFFHEGKENIDECLRIAFEAAVLRDVRKLVIFTGVGAGPKIALEKFRSQEIYSQIEIIAVTFPCGQRFKVGEGEPAAMEISAADRQLFRENNVAVVRAHLPFNPISAHHKNHGVLGQDLSLIGNALSIFGGSMSLCVQAALMACDAGEVELGEHVIALTSDTAILVRTSPTERLLTDFIVREILCKPMRLTVIKSEEKVGAGKGSVTFDAAPEAPQLNAPISPEE